MLCFEEYYEIHTLLKMLIKAKFDSDPVNFDIAGSPFTAKICEKTVKALIELETSEEKKKYWEYWLKLDHKHTIFTDEFIGNRRKELSEDGYNDEEIEQILSNEKNDKHNLTIWEIALINASRDEAWQKEDHSQQVKRAKNYLSPFIASDDEIEEFISLCLENTKNIQKEFEEFISLCLENTTNIQKNIRPRIVKLSADSDRQAFVQ